MGKTKLLLLIIILTSCSSFQKTAPLAVKDKGEAQSKQEVKVEQASPTRIVGSSLILKNGESKRKTYFLYGAEHLKLENYYFDIPVVYNKAVRKWLHYFLNKGRGFFERYSARAGRYAPILGQILEEHGLPRDLIFLAMAM